MTVFFRAMFVMTDDTQTNRRSQTSLAKSSRVWNQSKHWSTPLFRILKTFSRVYMILHICIYVHYSYIAYCILLLLYELLSTMLLFITVLEYPVGWTHGFTLIFPVWMVNVMSQWQCPFNAIIGVHCWVNMFIERWICDAAVNGPYSPTYDGGCALEALHPTRMEGVGWENVAWSNKREDGDGSWSGAISARP